MGERSRKGMRPRCRYCPQELRDIFSQLVGAGPGCRRRFRHELEGEIAAAREELERRRLEAEGQLRFDFDQEVGKP